MSTELSEPSEPSISTDSGTPAPGFAAELRDALSARGVLLVVGGLVLQLAFILSYIGAFHAPTPHRIPLAVVAPEQVSAGTVDRLNGLDGDPLAARAVKDEAAGRALIHDRTVDAVLLVNPQGTKDTLLVASAGGPAVSSATTQIIEKADAAQNRTVTTDDILPPAAGDGRGLSSFYLAIGWIVGGYLAAAILGVASGSRPANPHRTVVRLGVLAVYAVVSGLGGALIAGPVLGALDGHFAQLWAIGALTVLAAAATTVALQILLGVVGIGVTILVFVVLGNPSAGGAFPSSLLPPFWRAIGDYIPTGAGTTAVRNTVYFGGNALAGPLWVLAAYAVAGTAVAVLASARHRRGGTAPVAEDGTDVRERQSVER
ncbi:MULTISPECIES: DUF3533 domain-containing protein [unclassified Streptomyces]|uniref:DUF3533 domain-containing protein n=1 Tax=unclassified Streptomyces TaxID=2593676 RepID=UPI002E7A675A|nr:DUF3533 domain-containing protein [Streptomyces sp. JV176]MEE1797421.1 DUF3533 domain-containing protein [Streptomyces sp. JV176]